MKKFLNIPNSKLVLVLLFPFVVFFIVSAVFAVNAALNEERDTIEKQITDEAAIAAKRVNTFFLKYTVIAEQANLNPIFEKFLAVPEESHGGNNPYFFDTMATLESIYENNKTELLRVWLYSFERDSFIQADTDHEQTSSEWGRHKKLWFSEILQKRKTFFVTSGEAGKPDSEVVSIVSPVVDRRTNNILGVFGIDLDLASLFSLMKTVCPAGRDHTLLISDDGTIIYHPAEQYRFEKFANAPYSKEIKDKVAAGTPGHYTFTFGNEEVQGNLDTLAINNWAILSQLSKEDVAERSSAGIWKLGLLFGCVTILLSIVAIFLRNTLKNLENHEQVLEGEIQKRTENIVKQDEMLWTVNDIARKLLSCCPEDSFDNVVYECLRMLGEASGQNRVYIWKDVLGKSGEPCCVQVYEWTRGAEPIQGNPDYENVPYAMLPSFEHVLNTGECLNSLVANLSASEKKVLEPQGIRTILIAPIKLQGQRWGFIGIDNCESDELFSALQENMLQMSGFLLASSMRKRDTENRMRQAEEFTQITFNASLQCCTLLDEGMRPILCNDAVIKLFDLKTKEEWLSRFWDLFPEHQPCGRRSADLAIEKIAEAFKNGRCEFEWLHQKLDGEPIPTYITLVKVKIKGENAVAAYLRDLREVKAKEAEAREAEELTQIMFNTSPLCCTLRDKNLRLLACNDETVRLFGFNSQEEYLAKADDLIQEYQPDGRRSKDIMQEMANKAFSEGYCKFEWLHQNVHGDPIPTEITGIRINYKGEDVVALYVRDLREVKAKEVEASEAEERIQLLLNATPLCCNLWNSDFENMLCNDEAVRLFELGSQQEYLDRFQELSPEYQPGGKLSSELAREYIAKAFKDGYCRFEWLHQKLNGEPIPAEITLERVKYKDGYVVAGYTRDLREFKAMLDEINHTQLELASARDEAVAHSKAKSEFLAKMSHEIRTPMNAIVGLSELMLRGNIPPAVKEHAIAIKQAGANLLSIINDILDFSKIESGKLEIVKEDYILASVVNDVVNIVRLRLVDQPITFVVDVDANLPNNLIGDEVRIRQILFNLLSNAVKYTEEGFIRLRISGETSGEKTLLTLMVEDSGIGIKPEDLGKLFGEFTQFDALKNKGVEGTGLGLAIVKNLARAMGGDIEVDSEYGKGSTFTVVVPQPVRNHEKFAEVVDPAHKSILLYEPRELYATSGARAAQNMGVRCCTVANQSDFYEALCREKYAYIFLPSIFLEDAKNIANRLGLDCQFVVLTEYGESVAQKDIRSLTLPLYSLPMANVLNNVFTGEYNANFDANIYFVAPTARVLIVDDILSNLIVAEGLMEPYQMQIDTCESGAEAIELVKNNTYDIVFMDHMMPGMNGIEATLLIRELPEGKDLAIIALTANAVSGAKEMFISNGFDDFLAKPIELAKLDEVLKKWLPAAKKQKYSLETKNEKGQLYSIEGLDVEAGIAMIGGSQERYLKVLGAVYRDGNKKLQELPDCIESGDIKLYTIYVHALKSALANIGCNELSELAKRLEQAGREEDIETIQRDTPGFLARFKALVDSIGEIIATENGSGTKKHVSISQLEADLLTLKEEITLLNASGMDASLASLQKKCASSDWAPKIEQLVEDILLCEYDKAIKDIDGLLESK